MTWATLTLALAALLRGLHHRQHEAWVCIGLTLTLTLESH